MGVDDQERADLIAAALKRPPCRLWLGLEIDTSYEIATNERRIAGLKRMLLMFFVFYASAIGLDAMLGIADVGLRIRFVITAPFVLVCVLSLSPRWPFFVQGLLGTLPIILMVATIQIVGLHLTDTLAQRYLFAAGLFALHVNVSYAQRWRWTVVTAVANAALAWGVLVMMRGWGGVHALADLTAFNSAIAVATLCWSLRAEYARRNAFLYDRLTKIHAERLEKANCELQTLSLTDGLTGLPNRRAFDQEFGRAWLAARQQVDQPLGLLLIDIDHFKAFNDTLGHMAGDACLRRVADVIRDALGPIAAFPARYGGEEFAVILPACDAGRTREIGDLLRVAVLDCGLEHPGRSDAGALSISVGYVSNRSGTMTMAAMLLAADAGLYRAKEQGRNRVSSAHDDAMERDLAA